MRDRVPLFALLASAVTFLVSLYLPWQEVSHSGLGSGGERGVLGMLNFFSAGSNSDGWTTEAGVLASLAALVLVAAAAVALVRPGAGGRRLPLFPFALAVAYLAIAGLVVLHAEEALSDSLPTDGGVHYHYAYGAYLGITAAAVALLAAAFLERVKLARRPTGAELIAVLLSAGLLVAFLLPFASSSLGGSRSVSYPGVNGPSVVLATVGVCLLMGALLRSRSAVYVAGMIAVLVGATVNEIASVPRDYGAWTALGLSVTLIVVTAFVRRPARLTIPSLTGALAAAGAATYLIALFLPWQEFCVPGGRCYVTTGWGAGESSAAAGTLALVVILAVLVVAWSAAATAELALAIAIFTAVSGAAVENLGGSSPPGWSTAYGTYVGFAAAGVLLLAGLVRLGLPRIEGRRAIDRLIPVAASIACLCAIALPVWSALPDRWSPQVEVLGGWYAVAGVLLTLHLLRRWLEFMGGPAGRGEELVLLPLGVLALTTLALVHERGNGTSWGGWILVGLCIVLTLFGWFEHRGDLERLRVPDFLRLDRLPEAES
jgi:hypothetical protein